jgi:hypothetical protein
VYAGCTPCEDIPTTLTNVPITKIQLKERNQSHIHLLLPRVKSCDLKWQTYRTYNVLNSAGKSKINLISCVMIYENIMNKVILKAGVIIDWRSDVCVCTARDELLVS